MHHSATVFIVSDSIGETAEQVARSSASQFVGETIHYRRFHHVTSREQVDTIIREAQREPTLILYTIVIKDIQHYLATQAVAQNIPLVNVLEHTMHELAGLFKHKPEPHPGIQRQINDDYVHRISAVEFAVNYDDGKMLRNLDNADLVIIGVSRTSKTPLSMYLALKSRLRVANVPLVYGVPVPDTLFALPREQVVGLVADPFLLHRIRKERLRFVGMERVGSYGDIDSIIREVEYSKTLMHKIGCPIIDTTNRAIEETAAIILEKVGKEEEYQVL